MVQVQLIERFLITLIPSDHIVPVQNVFRSFQNDTKGTTFSGINEIQSYIRDENELVRAGAINGLLVGIFLARVSEEPDMQKIIEGWLEQYRRVKGEHVIDFNQFRSRKGRT